MTLWQVVIALVVCVGLVSGCTDANTYYQLYQDGQISNQEKEVAVSFFELSYDCGVFTASMLGSVFCWYYAT